VVGLSAFEGAVAVVMAWVLAVALEGRKVRRTEGRKEGRKKVSTSMKKKNVLCPNIKRKE
jgi:hypothetical protein